MDFLFTHSGDKSLKARVNDLFKEQLQNWDLAAANYAGLLKTITKSLTFSPLAQIRVQFNPERIYSTSAKVDPRSISERPCFLCPEHLPVHQKAIPFGDEYLLLVNPFPIFEKHLTIPVVKHVPQLLAGRLHDMLNLAKALDNFVVFYNGPRCGASAPDHFHFQAGNKGFMPIEMEFETIPSRIIYQENSGSTIHAMESCMRNVLVFSSPDQSWIKNNIDKALDVLSDFEPDQPEPMINILTTWNTDHWRIFLFPRNTHRPWQFFAEGNDKIMLSPAAVDLGGVLIIPRKEDFDKLDLKTSFDIFGQVSLGKEKWAHLVKTFQKNKPHGP